jgi:hypothetical protein
MYSFVDVEVIGLQKIMKFGSSREKTQAGETFHVRECCSQHGKRDKSNCRI